MRLPQTQVNLLSSIAGDILLENTFFQVPGKRISRNSYLGAFLSSFMGSLLILHNFFVWFSLDNFKDIFKYNYLILKPNYFTSFLIIISLLSW